MYNSCVFVTHFKQLKRKRELAENRDIDLEEIAKETGLSYSTISRFSNNPNTANLATVGPLCDYFNVRTLTDLIEWKPDPTDPTSGKE